MDVVSLCPFRASSFAWQAHTGAHALTVIVKATFLLRPGESVLAPEQEPVSEKERTWDDDPRRSIRIPSDQTPYKPRAEVMLVGRAYAPHRQPVRSLVARMIVGEIDKSIEVWCDRGIRLHDNQLLEGPRFVEMPLGWERAAGGPDTNNPVGMRFDAAPDRYGMVALPNLQPAGVHVSRRSDTFVPIGFGPVGAAWPGRAQRLGRHRAGFRDPGWEQSPLPADFDARYFQAAPPDQQVAEIRPNERIVLENLHPEHERLVTTLPGIRPRAIADRATGEREEVQLAADTLWIDTDRGLCCVVWRGRIGLRHATEAGRVAVWVDGMPMVAPAQEPSRDEGSSEVKAAAEDAEALVAVTLMGPLVTKGGPALPFVPGIAKLPELPEGLAADIAQWAAGMSEDSSGTILAPMPQPVKKVLPFGPEVDEPEDLAETIPPMPRRGGASTPSVPTVPPLQPLRFEQASSFGEPSMGLIDPAVARRPEVIPDEFKHARTEVVPPPMIGPLAMPEGFTLIAEMAEADEPQTRGAQPESRGETSPFPRREISLEECAAITASLDRREVDKKNLLSERGLSEEAWTHAARHWEDAIELDLEQGRADLLFAFDAAYVAQLQKERGEITLAEYAQLVAAAERGTTDRVLAELKIPEQAELRVERVWMERLMVDPELRKRLRAA